MMKKMTKLLLTALAAGTLLSAAAHAAMLVDYADLLTDEEEASLFEQMEQISSTYDFDVNIYTTNDPVYYEDAQFDADEIYDQSGCGVGENADGVLYYLRMSDRKYAVCTTGCGEYVFDDVALDILDEEMLPFLGNGDYYTAFCRYVSITPQMLDRANQDASSYGYDYHDLADPEYNIEHYGGEQEPKKRTFPIFGTVLSAIIAFFTPLGKTSSKKRQMNTAVASTNADRSMVPEGLKLSYHNDILMFSNITKVPRQTNNDRGSGSSFAGHSGGGHHTSMSGHSHGGRSGGF